MSGLGGLSGAAFVVPRPLTRERGLSLAAQQVSEDAQDRRNLGFAPHDLPAAANANRGLAPEAERVLERRPEDTHTIPN